MTNQYLYWTDDELLNEATNLELQSMETILKLTAIEQELERRDLPPDPWETLVKGDG